MQITFDTSIYPTANNMKGYDYVGLANACDFLVPVRMPRLRWRQCAHRGYLLQMAYDMDWAAKVATANSPYPQVAQGISEVLTLIVCRCTSLKTI